MIWPGNIYSGDRTRACFTNPTELAFQKGTVDKHYPVEVGGMVFADAEAAYHFYTNGCKNDFLKCQFFCTIIIRHKLVQHPELIQIIKENGGLEWIEKCIHRTYAKSEAFKRWEGRGLNSPFIKCLYDAYASVT